jgi:hypothetical protein
VRSFGAAGLALVVLVSASCAVISGLSPYSECDTCGSTSKSPATVSDSSTPAPGEDVIAPPVETPEPGTDATMGQPDEASSPGDTGADTWTAPPVDAQDVASPPIDAGPDSPAPVIDAGPVILASCGTLTSRMKCNANQVCCATLPAQTNACSSASACPANTTLACFTASDCPSSAPICCAKMTLVTDAAGDLPPKCTATGLAASCASSCNDSPPSNSLSCAFPPSGGTGLVRLCSHDADCTSDTANNGCYNFNGAPLSWCSPALAGLEGVHQP